MEIEAERYRERQKVRQIERYRERQRDTEREKERERGREGHTCKWIGSTRRSSQVSFYKDWRDVSDEIF